MRSVPLNIVDLPSPGNQGRGTGPGGMKRWRCSLVPQPAVLARGAIGRSPLQERGKVLGWARALSPQGRVSGASLGFWFLLEIGGLMFEQCGD